MVKIHHMKSKWDMTNFNKWLNSPKLLAAYKKELNNILLIDNTSKEFLILGGLLIKRIKFTDLTKINIIIKCMELQEKYKIHYILDCYVYDKDIFKKIVSSKYIHKLSVRNLFDDDKLDKEIRQYENEQISNHGNDNSGLQNIISKYIKDITFIFNKHIKKLVLNSYFNINIIAYIINNTMINTLVIGATDFKDFSKIYTALYNSKLNKLKIENISMYTFDKLTANEKINNINSTVYSINNSHIKLHSLVLTHTYYPKLVIEALLENIKLYNTMDKLKLHNLHKLSKKSSILLGQLIANSNLSYINLTACTVNVQMWHILNDNSYKNSYKKYKPLRLVMPDIERKNEWLLVRNMLYNNIRINNLIIKYCLLNNDDSHIFADGLLHNKVINNITFDKLSTSLTMATDYHIIFSNIINRSIKLEYLYINMFYYKDSVKDQLIYMLDNNWLKTLYIIDDIENYQYGTNALSNDNIIDIMGYLKNNNSLTDFYIDITGMWNFLNPVILRDTINDTLINNFSLLKCRLSGYNMPFAQRNLLNNMRKHDNLQDIMYYNIDINNIITNDDNDKQFIAKYIHYEYQ